MRSNVSLEQNTFKKPWRPVISLDLNLVVRLTSSQTLKGGNAQGKTTKHMHACAKCDHRRGNKQCTLGNFLVNGAEINDLRRLKKTNHKNVQIFPLQQLSCV